MNKKLKCIMLIDDNPNDNFFHDRIIKKTDCTETVAIRETAQEALESLRRKEVLPELIFLDVNMPGMTGWEFLEEFNKLEIRSECRVVVVMLTSSTNADDMNRASGMDLVADYQIKPLTKPKLLEVLEKHFPDYM